ncbi:ABC transporter permease [Catellatospora paridis]|uniref:ABC transporter permease n=1 Tax=Catellatospora paridis TaxID=1617086 RepID=UPI0012D3FC17|nr:ABC transporter permease [Catellatospora paridis]
MTTSLHPAPPVPARTRAAAPRARFTDLVAAEWIKLWSLRSTPWTLGLATLFVLGAAALAAKADYDNFPFYEPETQRDHMFSLSDAFPQEGYLTLMIVAVSLGALSVVSEYGSGLIRTTTAAVPARGATVLAKAVVTAGVWTATGIVIAFGSFAVSQAILAGRDAAVSLSDPVSIRAVAASALLAPVCALIGLCLGVLIRHAATTMVTGIFLLLMLPTMFSSDKRWSAELSNLMPGVAWNRLTTGWMPPPRPDYFPATITESWLVLAAWPLLLLIPALLTIRRRDV